MSTLKDNGSSDEQLDRLLRSCSLHVRENFNERTLERLRQVELAFDAKLDQMLAASPVEAGEAFEQEVFAQIRAEGPGRSHWWAPFAMAVALLVALVAITAESPVAERSDSQMVFAGEMSVLSAGQELAVDSQLAQLFALAEGLGPEAQVLLTNPDFSGWLAMAE